MSRRIRFYEAASVAEGSTTVYHGVMTATVTLDLPSGPWHKPFTALEREAFTFGDCWLLAREVEALCGLPSVFVGREGEVADSWCHVLNRLPDGRFVDVEGVWSFSQVLERWGREVGYWQEDDLQVAVESVGPEAWEGMEAVYADEVCSRTVAVSLVARLASVLV